MARMREPVGYQPFRLDPILQDSRIAQPVFGGDLWYRTADALAKAAGVLGQRAKAEQAQAQDKRDLTEALASSEGTTTIGGGPTPDIGPGDLSAAIDAAAAKHGEDAAVMRGIVYLESRGDVKAYNADSKAAGPFQFVPGTARDYGLANPYDPAQASDAAARLLKDNRAYLKGQLGREPTPGELYLAHQQGAGGAVKLLQNPDKLAVNVVPLQHILKNGGNADMTAGQFAKLWIDKMGGAPTVSRSGAGVRSSNPEHPFGRYAVDYWQRIKVSIDKDLGEIETRFGEDPAAMTAALTDLKKAYQPQVYQEIQADFDTVWQSATAPMLVQAGKRAEAKLTAEQQASFLGNVEQSEAARDRAVEAYVPGSNAGLVDLDTRQTEIDAQYDEAAKRGYITPLQASDAKAKSRRATVTRFYERQGEALSTPEDVAALRAKFHDDYAAGKLDGLDQSGWELLDARMSAIETAKRTGGDLADKTLKARGDDLAARVAAGGDVGQAEVNALVTQAGTAPNGGAIVRGTLAKIDVSRIVRALPIAQAETKLSDMERGLAPDAPTEMREAIAAGRKQIGEMRAKAQSDPLTLATDLRVLPPVKDLDFAGSFAPGDLAVRLTEARAAADHFGVEPRTFKPGELAALKTIASTDPERASDLLTGILSGAGADAPRVMREIGGGAPSMMLAGNILLRGGTADAARTLLKGSAATPEGQTSPYPTIKADTLRAALNGVGGALATTNPGLMREVATSAMAIARVRLAEVGQDEEGGDAPKIMRRAVQEAAGAQFIAGVQYGGITQVNGTETLAPSGIPADTIERALYAISDATLKALPPIKSSNEFPVTAKMLQRGRLIAVDDGKYMLALDDPTGETPRIVMGEDDQPWLLDLRSLIVSGAVTPKRQRGEGNPWQ